jgi:transcriptional regulator with XRE-family HTH domain
MQDETDWYGPEAATFGDRLAAARDAAGMGAEELARRLGVKLTTLESWEADRAEPRAHRLQLIAGLLDVSVVWLLSGEGAGVDVPSEGSMAQADMRAVLTDLRAVQAEMKATAERVGRLEKRLKALMQETQG